jgi:2-C-methyl-D-erythritol 4-phosphate cytidylyltransferase
VSPAANGTPRFTALVLAGSRGGVDPVAAHAGARLKCLVPAGGVPMLVRVVEALLLSPAVEQVLVSLPEPALLGELPALAPHLASGRCRAVASAASPSLSVLAVIDGEPDPMPLLVTTADHALLSRAIVETFCEAARRSGADVAAGLTPSRTLLAAYPDSVRTFLRFRDERYSGANLFAILRPQGRRAVLFWRRVEQERKRPWRIVRAFGLRSLVDWLLRRLTLDEAMVRASRVIGAEVRAVRLLIPEACIDVDKPADLDLVNAILARRDAA